MEQLFLVLFSLLQSGAPWFVCLMLNIVSDRGVAFDLPQSVALKRLQIYIISHPLWFIIQQPSCYFVTFQSSLFQAPFGVSFFPFVLFFCKAMCTAYQH